MRLSVSRLSVSLAALLVAAPALSDDFLVRADIAEATVYAAGAEVIRRIELELPAGTHRVLFPSDDVWTELPPIVAASAGVTIGEVEPVRRARVADGGLDSPAQAAARAAVEAAEDALEAATAELVAAGGAVRAAELQQAYLRAIVQGGETGVAMPEDAAALAAILATLGGEMARADAALHEARQAEAELRAGIEDRQQDLEDAERALADLLPFAESVDLWSVVVEVAEPVTATLEVTEFTQGGWRPAYEAHLDSETGALVLERHVLISAGGTLPWQDVAVTLSTADPDRRRGASGAWPSLAQVREEA
ncbi:MAG: DUF4139 domain-containing protein, partial [Pseudomonadota bacterium]